MSILITETIGGLRDPRLYNINGKVYAHKEPVYYPGDPADLLLVRRGAVMTYGMSLEGQQTFLGILKAPALLTDGYLYDGMRSTFAKAVGETEVAIIKPSVFKEIP